MDKIVKNGIEINISDVEKIDKISAGLYNITTSDGTENQLELNVSEFQSVHQKVRWAKKRDKSLIATKSSDTNKVSAPININKAIEKIENTFGSFLDVEYANPDLCGYWEADDGIPNRLAIGYEFSRPSDLLNFESQFADIAIGLESNPDGYIKRGDLTLMHIRKEIRDQIRKYNLEKRPNSSSMTGFTRQ